MLTRASSDESLTPEIAQKRLAVLEQAIGLFAEEGFRRADVQVVADRAGVGKGTVYRYFGNKEDLFWAAIYAVMERLEAHLRVAVDAAADPEGKLRAASLAYAEFFESNPRYLEIFVQDRAEFRGKVPELHLEYHQNLVEHFSQIVADGVAMGQFCPLDPRATIRSLSSMLYGAVVFHCYVRDQRGLVAHTANCLEIFLRGIALAADQRPGGGAEANPGHPEACRAERD